MSLPLVLLHGANGGSAEIEPLRAALSDYFEVSAPDWLGHGGRPLPPDIDMPSLAADFIDWMDGHGIESAWIAGYSLGGSIALYLARHYPERVDGVMALAAKVVFDAPTLKHWTYLASVGRLEGSERAKQLEKTHAPNDWRDVARMNQRFFEALAKSPPLDAKALGEIACPVMLANANRDQIVPWGETLALGKLIPRSKLVMFYGLAHPIRVVPVFSVARALDQWVRELQKEQA
ncbi:MAG TPA: alpha/beta fold hydrolase [Usitatibacter sp.]|nr:alpha/beta fold hydrolase [Usitatibacter sp.]